MHLAEKGRTGGVNAIIHDHHLFWLWILADIPILIGIFGKSFGISYRVHSLTMSFVLVATLLLITMEYFKVHLRDATKAEGGGAAAEAPKTPTGFE